MFYFHKTPGLIQNVLSDVIWRMDSSEMTIYLSFDDGPHPETTPLILNLLQKYKAKASFFCVGHQVFLYPDLVKQIRIENHTVGNHSYSHKNGWKCTKNDYLSDIAKANKHIESKLFRPPYGKMKMNQKNVIKENYHIVMWDVLAGDFDPKLKAEDCIYSCKKNIERGSIVVLHDNIKFIEKCLLITEDLLQYYSNLGFQFKALPMEY